MCGAFLCAHVRREASIADVDQVGITRIIKDCGRRALKVAVKQGMIGGWSH